MDPMTRKQAVDFFAAEVDYSLQNGAIGEEVEAGREDMYRAFEALGVTRSEVDGE